MKLHYITHSPIETQNVAKVFAGQLQRGDVVTLFGDLGSGKTQFVKGLCHAFHATSEASSPSFVILNRYEGVDGSGNEFLLYHFDLYRIKSATELYELGYEELFNGNGLCCIEWAEMMDELLPPKRYDIRFSFGEKETEREIEISSTNEMNT